MQTGKIGRQFRAETQEVMGNWVFDCEYVGMQGLPAKGCQGLLGLLRQKCRFSAKTRPVDVVPQ